MDRLSLLAGFISRATGCLAPHAEKAQAIRRIPWAEILARVFAIDMKHCGTCGGDLKPLAAIIEISAIRKILTHLGLPDKPPDIAPARLSPQMSF